MEWDRAALMQLGHLARLSVAEEDISMLSDQLKKIMGMVDTISSTSTEGVTPMAHPIPGAFQRVRPDEVTETNERDALLANAPESEAGLFLVPQVLDDAP